MSSRLDDLQAWRIFVNFAKTGSVSACAQVMGMEASSISRAIASLEKGCGQALIFHNSRPMELTAAGEKALSRMEPVLRAHQQLIDSLMADTAAMEGHIRFSAAPGFATRRLTPFLAKFRELFPNIIVDVVVGLKESEIAKGLCEVGVLTGRPKLPGLTFMSRGRNVYLPAASPTYIAKYGMPVTPADLIHHNVYVYNGPVREETKTLHRGEQEVPVILNRSNRMTDVIAIREALLSDMGVSIDMPLVQIHEDLLTGRLVPIMPGWMKKPEDCFVVTTRANWHIRRVRLFLEWYARQMQAEFASYEKAVAGIVALPPESGISPDEIFQTKRS